MAGFGGGRKSTSGVAGDETIQKNHALALADEGRFRYQSGNRRL
ncbi:MAG: lactate racemase domain-containing protein [Phascolarctobacterium faecium]